MSKIISVTMDKYGARKLQKSNYLNIKEIIFIYIIVVLAVTIYK